MRAIDAMIVWTPNKEPWTQYPSIGKVAVTTIPEPPELKRYPLSVGACDLDWRETDDLGRRNLMQKYFTQMIHEDGIDESVARAAIAMIDDFSGVYFSADPMPPEVDDE